MPGRVGMEEGPKDVPAPLSGGMDDGARGGEAACTSGGAEAGRDRPAELALPRSRSAPLPVKERRRGRERKRRDSALRFPRRRARFWPGGPLESSARAGREWWQGGVEGDGAVQDAVPDTCAPRAHRAFPRAAGEGRESRAAGTRAGNLRKLTGRGEERATCFPGAAALYRDLPPVRGEPERPRDPRPVRRRTGPLIVFSHHPTGNAAWNA